MSSIEDLLTTYQNEATDQARLAQQPPAVRPFQKPLDKPAPQPPQPAAPQEGLLSRSIKAGLKGAASLLPGGQALTSLTTPEGQANAAAVGASILRAPGQLIGGSMDTAADAGKFIGDNMHSSFVRGAAQALTQVAPAAGAAVAAASSLRKANGGASLADTLSMRSSLGQVGDKGVNQMATEGLGIAAALPFGGEVAAPEAAPAIARVAAKAAHLLLNSAKVGAATAVVSDPRAERISNMIQSAGVHGAIVDYLASNPDDPAIEGRLKSGIEGALGTAAVEPAFLGVAKLLKAGLAGDVDGVAAAAKGLPKGATTEVVEASPVEAAHENLDRAFATGRTQEARWQAAEGRGPTVAATTATDSGESPRPGAAASEAITPLQTAEPPKQAILDQGTRHTDAGAVDPKTKLATDANAALEKAGAAEKLDPDTMQVTPTGKIVVQPATKAAADGAGVGRAFAEDTGLDEPEHVIFKEVDGQGGSRVVGMMGKDDLQGLMDEAQHYVDHPEPSVDQINVGTAPDTAGRVGQWSIGKLGASYDVPAFMRALADRMPGSVRALSDDELHRSAKIIADQTGLHPDDVLSLGQQVAGNTQDLPIGMQALRTVQVRVMRDVMDLRGGDWMAAEEGSPEVLAAMQKVHNAATFAAYVEEAKTGIGQALRTMQLPDADAYLAGVRDAAKPDAPPLVPKAPEELPLPRNREELSDWLDQLDAISTTGDPSAVQAFLRGKLMVPGKWAYLGNSFANFFTGALVSAPRTLVRDLWGPAIISGFNTVGRMGAGTMLALNPALDAAARREAWTASWGAARAYATVLSDVADALRTAAKTTAAGFTRGGPSADPYWDPFGSNLGSTHSSLGGGGPIDLMSGFNQVGVPRTLVDAAMGERGAGVSGAFPFWAGNLINKLPQAVMALHGGFNDAAQTLAYLGEVRATAYNDAAKYGLEGDDFRRFVQQRLVNSRDPASGAATDPVAFAQAVRTTLTKRPTDNDPAILRGAFQLRSDMVKAFPPTRFILPIFTVPANALGESLRRIPGLGFAFKESGEALTGQHGVAPMVDAYGRMLTGAGALAAGVMLGTSGALTGAGPTNAADRQAWEGRAGDGSVMHAPYSIRIGGRWNSYAKSDVVGPLLSIMAAFYDRSVYDGGDLGEHAIAAAAGLAEYFKDQASLQGLAQVLNFGGNPQESASLATRVLGQVSSGFLPGFLRQIRDQIDPDQRVHHTVGDYIVDSIPGLSTRLDPVRNVLGEPVMKPQSPVFGTLPVSMANLNTFDRDPVQDENSRLFEKTGEAHGVLPSSLGTNTRADMRELKLEDGGSLYDALMRARMTSRNEDGQTLKEALTELYESQEYREAVDGKSTALADDNGDAIKGAMARQVFNEFTAITKADVANQSPLAARYLAVAQAMNHNPVEAAQHSAHDLAASPALLQSLGINISDYEEAVKGQ